MESTLRSAEHEHPVQRLWRLHVPPRGYPAGVSGIPRPIEGTAFFPGGYGLWGAQRGYALPSFPVNGVMIVGHNFDDEENFRSSLAHGGERLSSPTWRSLLGLLDSVYLWPQQCFFTNFFVGCIAGGKSTGVFPGANNIAFRDHCRNFFIEQIRVQRPALIVTLGLEVPLQLATLSEDLRGWSRATSLRNLDELGPVRSSVSFEQCEGLTTTVVALVHPSFRRLNVHHRRYAGLNGEEAEQQLLRDALAEAQIDRPLEALESKLDFASPRLPLRPQREHFRLERNAVGERLLYVRKMRWEGSHTPVGYWAPLARVSAGAGNGVVRRRLKQALSSSMFFRRCDLCGLEDLAGHFGADVCHGCMEREGVIF